MRPPANAPPPIVPVRQNFVLGPMPMVALPVLLQPQLFASDPSGGDWKLGQANETFANHATCSCNDAPCNVTAVLQSPARNGYALRSCTVPQIEAATYVLHNKCYATLDGSAEPDAWRFVGSVGNMDVAAQDVTAWTTDDATFADCFRRSLELQASHPSQLQPQTVLGYVLGGALLAVGGAIVVPKLVRAALDLPTRLRAHRAVASIERHQLDPEQRPLLAPAPAARAPAPAPAPQPSTQPSAEAHCPLEMPPVHTVVHHPQRRPGSHHRRPRG